MKRKSPLLLYFLLFIAINLTAFGFDMNEVVIYELPRGSTLADAFTELERLSSDEIVFYLDPEIDASIDFRLSAKETFSSILNLILYINKLEAVRLSDTLYYIYPQIKEEEMQQEFQIPFTVTGIAHTEDKSVAIIEYEGKHQIVERGETYMGLRVKDIRTNYVIFDYKGREIIRYLNDRGN